MQSSQNAPFSYSSTYIMFFMLAMTIWTFIPDCSEECCFPKEVSLPNKFHRVSIPRKPKASIQYTNIALFLLKPTTVFRRGFRTIRTAPAPFTRSSTYQRQTGSGLALTFTAAGFCPLLCDCGQTVQAWVLAIQHHPCYVSWVNNFVLWCGCVHLHHACEPHASCLQIKAELSSEQSH